MNGRIADRVARLLEVTVADDRGAGRPLYRGAGAGPADAGGPDAAVRRASAVLAATVRRRVRRVVIPLVLITTAAVVATLAMGGGPLVLLAAAAFAAPLVILRLLAQRDLRRWAPTAVRTLLASGHCASCGYALTGIPVEPDGCRTCPECGSAWHDQRIAATDAGARPAERRGVLAALLTGPRQVLVDAAGRAVEAVHPRLRGLRPAVREELPDAARRELARSICRNGRWRRGRNALAGTILVLVVGALATMLGVEAWARRSPALGAGAAWLAVAAAFLLREAWRFASGTHGIDPDHLRAVLLDHARCPSCAGRLQRGEQLLCPTCGSVWRNDPVHPGG